MRWSLTVLAFLASLNTGEAYDLCWHGGATVMYYTPVPVVWVTPTYVPCPTLPAVPAPAMPYAAPRATPVPPPPPSPPTSVEPPKAKTVEPPASESKALKQVEQVERKVVEQKKGPVIVESRSQSVQATTSERCKVGFWNLTGRQVQISVAGQTHTLARDRALTLDLPRQFSWQLEDGGVSQERVGADQAFHEVLLRE